MFLTLVPTLFNFTKHCKKQKFTLFQFWFKARFARFAREMWKIQGEMTAAEGRRLSNDVSRILCTLWVRIPVKYPLESLLLRPKIGGSNTLLPWKIGKGEKERREKIIIIAFVRGFYALLLLFWRIWRLLSNREQRLQMTRVLCLYHCLVNGNARGANRGFIDSALFFWEDYRSFKKVYERINSSLSDLFLVILNEL